MNWEKENFDFYLKSGEDYFKQTFQLDLNEDYEKFLKGIPKGGSILDAGCGAGRDLKYFEQMGYRGLGFDGSEKMISLAKTQTSFPIHKMNFNQIKWKNKFDGIWSSAALLHVQKKHLATVFFKLFRALKPQGILFASFKKGEGVLNSRGRFYQLFDFSDLKILLEANPSITLLDAYEKGDRREGREKETWLQILLKKL